MQKITLLLLLFYISVFSQSKSTAVIAINPDMTAQFTLDKSTSKVSLVLTGPSYKWTSVGIGTSAAIASGDVFVYTASVADNTLLSANPFQEWNTVSNTVNSGVRKVTLERALTNLELNDLQLAFDTTNSIDFVWSRSGVAASTTTANRGNLTTNFTTTLGIDDISLPEQALIYPNRTSGELFIMTQTNLSKVKIYNQTGSLVKTISINDTSNHNKVNVNDLPEGIYIFELQNETDSIFKKVLLN